MIKKVDRTKEEALEFQQQHYGELDNKKKFYDDLSFHSAQERGKEKMGDMENSSIDDGPGGGR